jgi:hypothetical protein
MALDHELLQANFMRCVVRAIGRASRCVVQDETAKAARHAEIARRYKRRRKGKRVTFASLRVRDLQRLFTGRHGDTLPNDHAGRIAAEIMAHHLSQLPGDPRRRIASWLEQWAPWLAIADAREITTAAVMRPKRWNADALGWRLKLVNVDRTALKITTIGAVDLTKAQRIKRRRQLARDRERERRKAQGAKPRAEYLASHTTSQAKPWIAAGISRASWYRRNAKP